jgi:hypothetical protein
MKPQQTVVVSDIPLRKLLLDLPVRPGPQENAFRVESSLWDGCAVPQVMPSFSSPVLQQEYLLQITCEFWSKNQVSSMVRFLMIWVSIYVPTPFQFLIFLISTIISESITNV